MKAGRELDALVAEKVMGEGVPDGYERVGDHWEKEEPIFDDDGAYTRSWQIVEWPALYSTHIAGAWQVVERLAEKWDWEIGFANLTEELAGMKRGWYALLVTAEDYCGQPVAYGETAPLAICLAALKAVGVEIE